jgi:hypothetical protein
MAGGKALCFSIDNDLVSAREITLARCHRSTTSRSGCDMRCAGITQLYEPFFADFGPLNLGQAFRYCTKLHQLLEVYPARCFGPSVANHRRPALAMSQARSASVRSLCARRRFSSVGQFQMRLTVGCIRRGHRRKRNSPSRRGKRSCTARRTTPIARPTPVPWCADLNFRRICV